MAASIRRRESCRLCEATDLQLVISLTPTPPANALVPIEMSGSQEAFPLDVHICDACGHLQLLDIVDPGDLYTDYLYVSGTSSSFVQHFRDYAAEVIARQGSKPDDLVVEIGSNDGTLLRAFADKGLRVLGIDPARAIAQSATEAGIPTLPRFFDKALAEEISGEHGRASVICANNVLAHIDDLGGVIDACKTLLEPQGVLVFEVAYALDMFDKTLFDMIYHEHLDYHSVKPLVPFFRDRGMELVEVQRVATHGGSLRCFAQPAPATPSPTVADLIASEEAIGINDAAVWRGFSAQIDALGTKLRTEVTRIRSEGGSIAGYGAPAKATTLLNHFGIDSTHIDYIVDDNPMKQGLSVPGTAIPIVAAGELESRRPDYLLILAWNFSEAIMAKEQAFHDTGGRFIVPLPEVSIR